MSFLSRLTRRRLDLDEREFDEEMRAHLDMATSERIAEGADPETAHYAALKEFGNVTLTTEAARRVWTPWWLEAGRDLSSDVRYAVRSLAKQPAFALTVVGVLALGIGLNAAVFTMLKGIALTPLAGVDGSARLHVVHGETNTGRALKLSYPDYLHLRDHTQAFSGLFGSALANVTLGRGRGARPVSAELVTGNYFQVLGVRAQRGRTLLPVGRGRARPPSGRGHQRRPVAARLRGRSGHRRQDRRDQQRPAHRRRRRRRHLPRHHRQLRRRGVRAADDGAPARLHLRQPGDDAVGHPRRPHAPRSSSRRASCGRARPWPRPPPRAKRSGPRSRVIARRPTRSRGCASCRSSSRRAVARPTSCRC